MQPITEIEAALCAPFDPDEVRYKPQVVKGNTALAIAYIDARVVQDRLDEVVGVGGWKDEYEILNDGSALCRLSVKIDGEWVTKMDVGGQSEQSDGGDRLKAAISDGLKRAAVKFGIGRYIYRLPMQWAAYDPVKKQFSSKPQLPKWAMPSNRPATQAAALQQPVQQQAKALPAAQPQASTVATQAGPTNRISRDQFDRMQAATKEIGENMDWLVNEVREKFAATMIREMSSADAEQQIADLQRRAYEKKFPA